MRESSELMSRIRDLFERSNLTLEELGTRMGARKNARMTAWQFVKKTKDPRLSMLLRLCDAMGVKIETLFSAEIDTLFDERKKAEQDAKFLERLIGKLRGVKGKNAKAELELAAAREGLRTALALLRQLQT